MITSILFLFPVSLVLYGLISSLVSNSVQIDFVDGWDFWGLILNCLLGMFLVLTGVYLVKFKKS